MQQRKRKLRVGDWVEVRCKEEILRTLDKNAQLDGMPFMPEMFAFCGRRFQVYKRAHKTCDTVFPIRGRRVDQAIHLDTRCDGSAHGGCNAGCLLFWKEAWLKPVNGSELEADRILAEHLNAPTSMSECTEPEVWARTRALTQSCDEPTYSCQATQLPYATKDLEWWDPRQYAEDLWSGNVTLWQLICGGIYSLYYALSVAGIGFGRPMRWLYDKFHPLWGGTPFPRRTGTIPEGQSTPMATLDLQPGELVRIKSYGEILNTLDTSSKNRGLYFDAEEVPYCGKTYRVLKLVTKIIDERTGRMQEMRIPSVILESVFCLGRYSECRMFCPRSIYPFWREIWLERVGSGPCTEKLEQQGVPAQQSELVSGG